MIMRLRGKPFLKGHEPWNKGKNNVYSKDVLEQMSKCRFKHFFEHGAFFLVKNIPKKQEEKLVIVIKEKSVLNGVND